MVVDATSSVRESLSDLVRIYILEEEDTSEVTDTTRVYPELDRWHTNDSQLDTLSFVELIVSVEEKFDIDICDSEAEKIKTFKDLVDCVEMLVKSH